MSAKVILASDSTSDLNEELIARYGVRLIPLTVNLGENQYTDGVDINPDMIYRYYEEKGALPKTAAPSIAAFESFFAEQTALGNEVVLFTISAEMSATYNNARIAAEDYPNVFVVDTRNLSTGGGLLVVTAGEMIAAGKGGKEIAEACREMTDRVDASFVIDNLEFLHKGGRCSAVAAFGANLLQLKPCIMVRDGKMGVDKKYRGSFGSTLKKYVADRLGDGSGVEADCIFVTHAGCEEALIAQCVEQVKGILPHGEVHVTRAGCTISSHCGRNTLGVLFIRKANE